MEYRDTFFTMHWHALDIADFTTQNICLDGNSRDFILESRIADIEIEIQDTCGVRIQTMNIMYKPVVIYSDLLIHVECPYMRYDLCLIFVDGQCSVVVIKDNANTGGTAHVMKFPFSEVEILYHDFYMIPQIRAIVFNESEEIRRYM